MSYTSDFAFLQQVNKFRVKQYSAAIMILDFATEHPIARIEGKVTQGNISLAAGTATRRTGSLTVVFDLSTFDLTNPDNLIAINKKVSISIGVNNPFYNKPERWGGFGPEETAIWELYPPTLWFKQGLFIITAASSSVSAGSMSVQMQFIDKGGMLNGVCGGTIPAGISLHDKLIIDGDGNVTVDYPIIRQIIQEVVHHFGDEHPSRIVINDLPAFGRQVVRYQGRSPIRFPVNSETPPRPIPGGFVISDNHVDGFDNIFRQGDDVGYMLTPLTFPGELTKNAGATVTSVLDAICNALGNYEYFYDVDGYFIFQRIQHFEMTGEAPVNSASGEINSPFNVGSDFDDVFQSGYLPRFSDTQFINEFMSADLVSQANHNPQFQHIRNDFVVWGSRQREGQDSVVRMRLSIDEKPRERWIGTNVENAAVEVLPLRDNCLCYQWVWEVRDNENMIVYYHFSMNADDVTISRGMNFSFSSQTATADRPAVQDAIGHSTDGWTIRLHSPSLRPDTRGYTTAIVGPIRRRNSHAGIRANLENDRLPFEWREELYRMALKAHGTADEGTYYDAELRAEWREIFDPNNDIFFSNWREQFGGTPRWTGYTREIVTDPSSIRYWIDIIESNTHLGQYSVNRIGRRSVVEDNSQIHEVLTRQTPGILFIDGGMSREDLTTAMQEQIAIGQNFVIVRPDDMPLFQPRNSFGTCYEMIRNLMHFHLIYNASVTVNSVPMLHLDVNRIVRLNFPEQGIVGNYVINRLSWNLGGNPRMSLTAQQAVVIV